MADYGFRVGDPDLKTVGPLAFSPEGILFIADSLSARVLAVDVGDSNLNETVNPIEIEDLDAKLASYLGCPRGEVGIRDLQVHPVSKNVYVSVMRRSGDAAIPVIFRINGSDGSIEEVSLRGIPFSSTTIANAPAEDDAREDILLDDPMGQEMTLPNGNLIRFSRVKLRNSTVTDLSYMDGELWVAGASNEELASSMRRIPFPFEGKGLDNSLEIFHTSHGRWETASPIRTFVPFKDNQQILASFTCTPLVAFNLIEQDGGAKVTGVTVAELGGGNQPLDMIFIRKGDEECLLVSNSTHGLLKFNANEVERQAPLVTQTPEATSREKLDHPGVSKMANLNGEFVLMLQTEDERMSLRSVPVTSI